MQYLTGAPIRPQAGCFYELRAGLRAFVFDTYDLYGIRYARGFILDHVPVTIFWYPNGYYSPGGQAHELDVMKLSE